MRPCSQFLNPLHISTLALLVAASAGCGISNTGPVQAGPPASGIQPPGASARSARLYYTSPYGIRAVSRLTDRPLSPLQALELLLKGPTSAEHQRGLTTHVPPIRRLHATATDGVVDVYLPQPVSIEDLDVAALSQITCTAAHAKVPGDRPPTQVRVRIHETRTNHQNPWTVRCGSNGQAKPVIYTPLTQP